jgi:hypothetical protein
LEVFVAVVVGLRALDGSSPNAWFALWVAAFLVASQVLRVWGRFTLSFAEQCRRVASKAYAMGVDVPSSQCSNIDAEAPKLALGRASKLVVQNLDEYYEATKAVGCDRLQELCAHSSFYSWQLLGRTAQLYTILAVFLFLVGGLVIYAFASIEVEQSLATRVLDVVCSVVFVVFWLKAMDACIAAWASSSACKKIAEKILEESDFSSVEQLVQEYDIERSGGPTIPTFIYMDARDELQLKWHQRRQSLD